MSSTLNVQKAVGILNNEITAVKADMEKISREQLAKTVIIYGMPEDPNENYKDIDKKIEELKCMLEMPTLDYDNARRMGKPRSEGCRPIELKLLRQRDKAAIFEAKPKLQKSQRAAKIYISPARTKSEQENYKKLLEYAREMRTLDAAMKFRIIRGQILDAQSNGKAKQFCIDLNGKVVEQKESKESLQATVRMKKDKIQRRNHPANHKSKGEGES